MPRLVSSLSVMDEVHLGSSFSLRGFARLGSDLSVIGEEYFGASVSLRSFMRWLVVVSPRRQRLGSSVSMLDFVTLGSSLAFSLALFARIRYGAFSFFLHCQSPAWCCSVPVLALRVGRGEVLRLSQFGASHGSGPPYVFDRVRLGASRSLRSFARIGACGTVEPPISQHVFAPSHGTFSSALLFCNVFLGRRRSDFGKHSVRPLCCWQPVQWEARYCHTGRTDLRCYWSLRFPLGSNSFSSLGSGT